MSIVDVFVPAYRANRRRTLGLLEQLEQQPDPTAVFGWRPGAGRAHIAWQLMHIGVTEELFASERLAPQKPGEFTELWPRFRGGSTPDDDIPSAVQIRRVLERSRQRLLETLHDYGDDRLGEIPPSLAVRQLTMLDVLHILGWHEGHHQGQAHITFNLWKHCR
ncbi:MAG TPA: DinB family protein [Pirellulales bacterium]|jgi:uncharacterized damage-inducible protein DinB|nr:DinB family protein [Pirellulales bacterium]